MLRPPSPLLLAVGLLAVSDPPDLAAQRVRSVDVALYREVMPGAVRFGPAGGDPPVVPAYRTGEGGAEVLHGYVFLTADVPPEPYGYSGPVDALVGMRLDGTLTGVRVTFYQESYRASMGDFLRRPGVQEQFRGKYVGDPFRVWDDVDGVSRASISMRALARGVRDAARRVANAYGLAPDVDAIGGADADPVALDWYELRQLGLVERFEMTQPGEGSVGIALALMDSERVGRHLLGDALYRRALQSVERRGGADHLVLYAIDGPRLRLFRREGWSVVQDADTVLVDPGDVVSLGLPSGGVVAGEATLVGLMLLNGPIDIARPFTFVYEAGDLGVERVEYVGREARLAEAEAARAVAAREETMEERGGEEATPVPSARVVASPPPEDAGGAEEDGTRREVAERGPVPEQPGAERGDSAGGSRSWTDVAARAPSDDALNSVLPPLFEEREEETLLEGTLASTRWERVALLLLVLALAVAAFTTRSEAAKWTSLTATLLLLGFVDGGFLSVSHITSGIWTGVDVFARDLHLLLLVAFTLATTLIWGRIFCGFLCPFGALQDFLDRLAPARWKRELPQRAHDRAVWIKFALLGVILLPALLGSRASVYHYFEPFGTVFFLSPSLPLWIIAGAFLGASIVVPRFYCRYACPLGASLAVLSVFAWRRIERVPQCDVCKVCEQRCPTRAIRGPEVDFPECVRCNVCEVLLETRAGACRHDMDDVRARLVNLEVGPRSLRPRSGVPGGEGP
ncbi:MAG: 4Fe-4S binding protein [Longimicrobiales bacterium]|nr:4Fe-4S binding protein [Longimicrobiales bacterium]